VSSFPRNWHKIHLNDHYLIFTINLPSQSFLGHRLGFHKSGLFHGVKPVSKLGSSLKIDETFFKINQFELFGCREKMQLFLSVAELSA